MKNSAWYHKLWRKKLDEYPLKEDASASWAEMNALLDKHMPAHIPATPNKTGKSFGSTVVSMIGYILPAAAMIAALTYVAIKHPGKNKEANKQRYNLTSKQKANNIAADRLQKTADTLKPDSAALSARSNLTAPGNGQAGTAKIANGQLIAKAPAFRSSANNHANNTANNKIAGNNKSIHQAVTAPATIDNTKATGITGSTAPPAGTADNKTNRDSANIVQPTNSTGSDDVTGKHADGTATGDAAKLADNKPGAKEKAGSKMKPPRTGKIKSAKSAGGSFPFDFNISAGLNVSNAGSNISIGAGGAFSLGTKWLLNANIKADPGRPLAITFNHPSYNLSDTSFAITASRNLTVISVPVNLEYKLSDRISVNAGPQISFSARQSAPKYKLKVTDYRDTLSHTHTIDSALRYSSINKVNIGVSAGLSVKVGQFYIDGTFLQNITPYAITNGFGSYKQYYRSFQVGLRYKFKKKSR